MQTDGRCSSGSLVKLLPFRMEIKNRCSSIRYSIRSSQSHPHPTPSDPMLPCSSFCTVILVMNSAYIDDQPHSKLLNSASRDGRATRPFFVSPNSCSLDALFPNPVIPRTKATINITTNNTTKHLKDTNIQSQISNTKLQIHAHRPSVPKTAIVVTTTSK